MAARRACWFGIRSLVSFGGPGRSGADVSSSAPEAHQPSPDPPRCGLARIESPAAGSDPIIGGRYLLHEDGRFSHAFLLWAGEPDSAAGSAVVVEHGRFSRVDSIVAFQLEGHSWTGTVRVDSLVVDDPRNGLGMEVYATSPVAFPLAFPAVDGAAEVYDREAPHSIPSGVLSRYILLPNGRFELQYLLPSYGLGAYPGRYARRDSTLRFEFDNPSGPPWIAVAIVHGNAFVVEYNIYMALSGFEDGWYVLAPDAP